MFELTSPAFKVSAQIPKKFTCDGEDVSPRLEWKNMPASTAARPGWEEDNCYNDP